MAPLVKNPTRLYEGAGLIPGLTGWVKDPALPQPWLRSQEQFGSGVAMVVA